jgi:hypothetical protein
VPSTQAGRCSSGPQRSAPTDNSPADNVGTQQQWAITALGGGAYRLTNRRSGKALDNANIDTEGNTVIQWSANGGSLQQWNMTKLS